MGSIYVCGDLHGNLDFYKLYERNWPEQTKLTEEDVLIQLGDFGIIWEYESTKQEKYLLDILGNKKYTVAFVDGNHENHKRLNEYPIDTKWGGKVHVIATNNKPIYHLIRGEVYNINGKKCIALGGADSQDRLYRIVDISWWKEESWTYKDCDYIYSQLKNNSDIEYVFAHTCPSVIGEMLLDGSQYYKGKSSCSVANNMNNLLELFTPKQWHFGHWHETIHINYNNIDFFGHYNGKPHKVE